MKKIIYCYAKCSTCQKAISFLEKKFIDYELRDIVKNHPDFQEMKKLINQSGLEIRNFFNTSGILYRDLNLKDKLPEMSEDKQIQVLVSNGMLIKRPLLINDNSILLGFNEKTWERLLK